MEAIRNGKRWLLGPPSFCMFNWEEPFNFLAQRAVQNWQRPGWKAGDPKGPRTVGEVQVALHNWLCYIRRPMPANLKRQKRFKNYATLEEFYVADCFQQRGGGRYFEALFENNPVYKEVLAARAANDGAYTVSYDGKDIECLNLSMTGPAYELPSRAERRKPVARRRGRTAGSGCSPSPSCRSSSRTRSSMGIWTGSSMSRAKRRRSWRRSWPG